MLAERLFDMDITSYPCLGQLESEMKKLQQVRRLVNAHAAGVEPVKGGGVGRSLCRAAPARATMPGCHAHQLLCCLLSALCTGVLRVCAVRQRRCSDHCEPGDSSHAAVGCKESLAYHTTSCPHTHTHTHTHTERVGLA